MESISWSNIRLSEDEASARGTQIKRLLRINDDDSISAEQLEYLKKSNIPEIDDTLLTFLNTITDFDSAAKWLSDNSFPLVAALTLLDYDFLKDPHGKKGF